LALNLHLFSDNPEGIKAALLSRIAFGRHAFFYFYLDSFAVRSDLGRRLIRGAASAYYGIQIPFLFDVEFVWPGPARKKGAL